MNPSPPDDMSNRTADEIDGEPGSEPTAPQTMRRPILTAVAFEGGLGVLAVLIGWGIGFSPLDRLRWSTDHALFAVGATLPLVTLLLLINRHPVGPLKGLQEVVNNSLVPLFRNCRHIHFAIIALLAGLGEELLFRWLIQGKLDEWLRPQLGITSGAVVALLVASAIFGLMHPITKLYAFLCFVMGLYLGWLYQITGNLWVPILVHALYDYVALVYLVGKQRKI